MPEGSLAHNRRKDRFTNELVFVSPREPRLCPTENPKLLQLLEWEANRPDYELPASFIRYNV
jgi:hypothetical protein